MDGFSERTSAVEQHDFFVILFHNEEIAFNPPFQINKNLSNLLSGQILDLESFSVLGIEFVAYFLPNDADEA